MKRWFKDNANDSDVVLFSRISLARNLSDIPFKTKMSGEIKKSTVKKLYASIKNSELAGDFELVDLNNVSPVKAVSYAERQLISPEFAAEKGSFLLAGKENASIMLCEEDHIKITAFAPGLDVAGAWALAESIDNVFLKNLKIAFSDKLGFLTASPTNIGTGLKASVLLHLPAIKANGAVDALASMVSRLSLSLVPCYGDSGAFYMLTNQISLGITEKSALDNIKAVTMQIIRQERNLREVIKGSEMWEDKLYRSCGVLKMARRLDYNEALEHLSNVRLGAAVGFFDYDLTELAILVNSIADGTLLCDYNCESSPEKADKIRADAVHKALN
ncbi:MAG: hypothetical protein LUH82_02190 [Clostridiales bacterium]|nr:hypothetical protein [Clostridiales bacterium]